ncbi:MAG: Dam family site-specific DNA-(adenine-N6)-methyltransferase [Chloroflexi bacterium]|nr:Dam family site-specific DNA-(adenine-N6)-methyltransferase [Chloroflexota bacterium]
MAKVFVPPIKCQGIKTKLVSFIRQNLTWDGKGVWVEPFIGSGVVGFNIRPNQAIFADSNPHIINFYQAINENIITPASVRKYLEHEDQFLRKQGSDYYYQVRERFNKKQEPLDFLFLNRAGFNGMIRFNQKGKFNVPFNHKPNRFSKAYITKIVNQVQYVHNLCQLHNYTFICQDFRQTLHQVDANDFVYCDPPYAGRHADYYNGWSEEDERDLLALLSLCSGRFILSTWHSNQYRSNPTIPQFQKQYHIVTKEHYYHVGAKESNRNPVLEALIMNYQPTQNEYPKERSYQQAALLESGSPYLEFTDNT